MLEAQTIKDNWDSLRYRIDQFEDRKDALNKLYDDFEDRMVMAPASGTSFHHNAFAGGYVDHVLRVMDCANELYDVWARMGADVSGYTMHELQFAALNHDLGKMGFPGDGNEVYQVETSDWHRKNMGRMYVPNKDIPFAVHSDLSLYLLQHYKIPVSWNETLAIKVHDGVYNDGAKPYYMARSEQAKMKNHMPLLLHHADHMATQIEYERYVNNKKKTLVPPVVKSKISKSNGLKNLGDSNPALSKELQDIFAGMGKTEDK